MTSSTIAALFRLRLLTAQRGGEVHGARWDEMELTTGWWTIPAARSKNRLAHRVPLSAGAEGSEGSQGGGRGADR